MERKKDLPGVGASLLTDQQERYFRLMRQGMNNVQACRAAGVTRKTGTRWRLGRTERKNGRKQVYLPVGAPTIQPISSRYLSEAERVRIADLHRLGRSARAIGTELGRAPSTITRELARNSAAGSSVYLPHHAHRAAAARRARPKPTKLAIDPELRAYVDDCLRKRWSPEQISHALTEQYPDHRHRHLAIETLYRAVYRPNRNGLKSTAAHALRTGRKRRRSQRHPHRPRHGSIIAPTDLIDHRPAEVADRVQPGHWEGDLIIGNNGGSAIATLVERTARFLILVHLPDRRTAEALRTALIPAMADLPPHLRRTITWDQGKEMALHRDFTATTGTSVYFCHPHSPWERGSNENMNGLLRQYFPKGSDLSVHSSDTLAAVAAEINERPRKTLGWKTPASHWDILHQTTN
jgi:IS30 family transposase